MEASPATTSIRVAIVGGGIAGPALALLLKQKLGVTADVFERDTELREVGAGISLTPNGARVLYQLGIKEELQAAGGKIYTTHVRRNDGSSIVSFPTNAEEQYGIPMMGVRRHRLRKVLMDKMAAEGIPLHLNKQLKSITQPMAAAVATGPAVLQFEDGSSYKADLVVGCDGLRSATRQALFGPQELNYTGHQALFAVCAERNPDVLPPGQAHMVYGRGNRYAGMYSLGNDSMGWFTVTSTPESRDGWGVIPAERFAEEQARVLAEFAGWVPVQTVAGLPVTVMVKVGIYDRDAADTWTKGTVTLAGDAANPIPPNLGQGGNKALEDVGCLAEALAHTFHTNCTQHKPPTNPTGDSNTVPGHTPAKSGTPDAVPDHLYVQLEEALALYEAVRLPRAAMLLSHARKAGSIARVEGRVATWLRDSVLRALVWVCEGSPPSGWLWGYDCGEEVAKAAAAASVVRD